MLLPLLCFVLWLPCPFAADPSCPRGVSICDDPHVEGLLGQRVEFSGVSGAWYSFLKDVDAGLDVNVRVTAPLEEEFPDRQLVTGVAVLFQGHSTVIQVKDPSNTDTNGCDDEVYTCLADGGLQVMVDGEERPDLLSPSIDRNLPGGTFLSSSNLPVECRQFGGAKVWAHMYEEMLQDQRTLLAEDFEQWILESQNMAAHDWCAKYVAERGLSHVQSSHAVFKIETPYITLRLNAGINSQSQDVPQLNWDGRILPELDFWQMDLGVQGLNRENHLSGILGETAYPVRDSDGEIVMEGPDAIRGTVREYRVAGAWGTDFELLHNHL